MTESVQVYEVPWETEYQRRQYRRMVELLEMVSANLHHPELGGISSEQLAAIDEAIGK